MTLEKNEGRSCYALRENQILIYIDINFSFNNNLLLKYTRCLYKFIQESSKSN